MRPITTSLFFSGTADRLLRPLAVSVFVANVVFLATLLAFGNVQPQLFWVNLHNLSYHLIFFLMANLLFCAYVLQTEHEIRQLRKCLWEGEPVQEREWNRTGKQVFEQVSWGKKEWEATLDQTEEAILAHTPEGRVTRLNAAAARLFGAMPNEVAGKDIAEVQRRVGWQNGECVFCAANPGSKQAASVTLPNSPRSYSVTSTSVDTGTPGVRVIHVVTDVTRQEHMQRLLVARERMAVAGVMAATLAHEINNPLTSVLGYTELAEETCTDPRALQALQIIKSETRRATGVVRNLRRFTGQARFPRVNLQINTLVREVVEVYKPNLGKDGITIEWKPADPSLYVHGSRDHIELVISNLLDNAARCLTNNDGHRAISIRVDAEEAHVWIRVTEHVSERSAAQLAEILAPLETYPERQADLDSRLETSVARAIARQHGGDLAITPILPRGAVYELRLPRVEGTPAAEPEANPSAKPHLRESGK